MSQKVLRAAFSKARIPPISGLAGAERHDPIYFEESEQETLVMCASFGQY